MTDFAKGVHIKTVTTRYGEILKIGIKLEEFSENTINERGYINFNILRAKATNKPYAVLNATKSKSTDDSGSDEIMQFDDIENISF